MTKRGVRWIGLLSAISMIASTSRADSRAQVHGIEWRFGPGGSPHSTQTRGVLQSSLFPRNRPWGPNEYLLIGAGVVVTIVVIVLATDHHHHDDPPHP